jgi:hypothetical protein
MKTTPKEATMYRRNRRRILKSLVLGLAVAALAAPAALAEPRGPGNQPSTDLVIVDAIRHGQSADDRSFYRGSSPQMVSPDDRSLYRGTSAQAARGYAPINQQARPDLAQPRGYALINTQARPAPVEARIVSPDDRSFVRGVETPNVPVTVSVSSSNDFQWADAALGAASTLAFVLLLGIGSFMIRHQRRRLAY